MLAGACAEPAAVPRGDEALVERRWDVRFVDDDATAPMDGSFLHPYDAIDLAVDDPVTGGRLIRYSTARYQRNSQTQVISFTFEWLFPNGEMRVSSAQLAVHIFSPRELHLLYRLAGYRVEAIYGDYSGAPFSASSSHLIMIGTAARP